MTLGLLAAAAFYLNRPAYEILYVGLEKDDIAKVGLALSEAGFTYDVDSNGSTISIATGTAAQARMLLAEKGLPTSAGAGYELFDNLGSLGLTSFMQEVTRIRALEGEISKSIQAFNGIKAARVHIVLPDKTLFSNREQRPTASVLIRGDPDRISASSNAVKHLVAAAVPGLATDNVFVMDSNGNLLSGGQNELTGGLINALEVQRNIERALEQKVGMALGPQLGAFNFRVTVQAQIDTDRQAVQETIFDPASRVERSVQVTKSEDSSTQQPDSKNPSVDQKLPQAQPTAATGPVNAETSEKREETTNFEISSKKVDTERNGYRIQKLAISIVLNKAKIAEILGQNAQPADIDARVAELQKIATAAAGFDEARGDKINIAALEFVEEAIEPVIPQGLLETLRPYMGTAVNALAFLIVALLLIFMGVRPLIGAMSASSVAGTAPTRIDPQLSNDGERQSSNQSQAASPDLAQKYGRTEQTASQASPIERLRALAAMDPEKASNIIRSWLVEGAA